MSTPEPLAVIEQFLRRDVVAEVNAAEGDVDALQALFGEFRQTPALVLQVPEADGGVEADAQTFARYRIMLARHSGALSFLQAQHQVALSKVLLADDVASKREHLRSIVQGDTAWGIGFVSARRASLVATPDGDGFRIRGTVPWITGHGFLDRVVARFDHEGRRHYFHFPFAQCSDRGVIELSAPIEVCVFQALNTVAASLVDWRVGPQELLFSESSGQEARAQPHNSVYTLAGAAHALLDCAFEAPSLHPALERRGAQLRALVDDYCARVVTLEDEPSHTELRARATQLAESCAQLARFAWSGRALLTGHPVNRLCREVWQYNVAGMRPDDVAALYPG